VPQLLAFASCSIEPMPGRSFELAGSQPGLDPVVIVSGNPPHQRVAAAVGVGMLQRDLSQSGMSRPCPSGGMVKVVCLFGEAGGPVVRCWQEAPQGIGEEQVSCLGIGGRFSQALVDLVEVIAGSGGQA
jgi:hypothetical protein